MKTRNMMISIGSLTLLVLGVWLAEPQTAIAASTDNQIADLFAGGDTSPISLTADRLRKRDGSCQTSLVADRLRKRDGSCQCSESGICDGTQKKDRVGPGGKGHGRR